MREYRSISTKIALKVIIPTAILFTAIISVNIIMSASIVRKHSLEKAEAMVDGIIMEYNKFISEIETAADNMIWNIQEHLDDPQYMYHVTEKFVDANAAIIGSCVAFEPNFYKDKGFWFAPYSYKDYQTGDIIPIQMGNEDYKYHEMEWYTKAKDSGQPSWCDPYFDLGGGNQLMTTYSIPMKDKEGKVFAIFTADVSIEDLSNKIADVKPYEHSKTIITTDKGKFLRFSNDESVEKNVKDIEEKYDSSKSVQEIVDRVMSGERGYGEYKIKHGYSGYAVFGSLSNNWRIVTTCLKQDIFKSVRTIKNVFSIIALLGFIALFTSIKKAINNVTAPITEFSYAAQNIAKGYFNAKIPEIHSQDELGRLHDSLQYMEESITRYIHELRNSTASNERFESELHIASGIQRQMLRTDFPHTEHFDLFADLKPAKEVGGDLYDYRISGDYLHFAIGDVSGKGVSAAMYMAITRSAFSFLSGLNISCADTMKSLNNAFCSGNNSGMFVTMFYGRLNMKTGEMTYCNAGHNPIVVTGPDGHASFLHAKPNIAAGLFEDFPYEEEKMTITPGSRLLLYTDGVTEAEDKTKQLFGDDRLIEFCNALPKEIESKDVASRLLAAVQEFTNGNEQNDDITMLALRIS